MAHHECSGTVMNATEPRSAAPQQAKATATEHRLSQRPAWLEASAATSQLSGSRCVCHLGEIFFGGGLCNRRSLPGSDFCGMCTRERCWCSCADCDPSTSSSGEDNDFGLAMAVQPDTVPVISKSAIASDTIGAATEHATASTHSRADSSEVNIADDGILTATTRL